MPCSWTVLSPDAYPAGLQQLRPLPESLWVSGPLESACVVAIVGTRTASLPALEFASALAGDVVRAGGVVVSGGAMGIDAAAHRGALAAQGRTWVVMPTGMDHVYPRCHAPLYTEILEAGGAWISSFPPAAMALPPHFFQRNGVLVALAQAVVVVQAGIPSGALNAASWAQKLGRPLWVVPSSPWTLGFEGGVSLLARGIAQPLVSIPLFLESVGLKDVVSRRTVRKRERGASSDKEYRARAPSVPGREPQALLRTCLHGLSDGAKRPCVSRSAAAERTPTYVSSASQRTLTVRPCHEAGRQVLTPQETSVLEALGDSPLHLDEIVVRAGLSVPEVITSLLTLTLHHQVAEGPEGFWLQAPLVG